MTERLSDSTQQDLQQMQQVAGQVGQDTRNMISTGSKLNDLRKDMFPGMNSKSIGVPEDGKDGLKQNNPLGKTTPENRSGRAAFTGTIGNTLKEQTKDASRRMVLALSAKAKWIIGLVIAVCVFLMVAVAAIKSEGTIVNGNVDLTGLPPFITEEMVIALIETQENDGIPVSTGLAQIIAESGFGVYGPNGESGQGLSGLAYNCRNLFGIKYWSGDSYATGCKNYNTGEQAPSGDRYMINAGFSIYSSYTDCIKQRAVMLNRAPYYSRTIAVYKNNCDGTYTKEQANGFMKGIREAGWATSLAYAQNCIAHMEQYNLYRFDNVTLSDLMNPGNGIGAGLSNPCPSAYISSEFGPRRSPGGIGSTNHKGRDYAAASGTPIYASASGTVVVATYNTARGYYVIIDHGEGVKTVSQHCSAIYVNVGDSVTRGQTIAAVGSTGFSTGPHLHFEVWINEVPQDPRNYLQN